MTPLRPKDALTHSEIKYYVNTQTLGTLRTGSVTTTCIRQTRHKTVPEFILIQINVFVY